MASPSSPRLRYNNLASLGTSPANAITFADGSTTTGSWVSDPGFPTIAAPNYAAVIVDPQGTEEIVYLTAFTATNTSGTFVRAQEGTSGAAHSSKAWSHGPTAYDFALSGDQSTNNIPVASASALQFSLRGVN